MFFNTKDAGLSRITSAIEDQKIAADAAISIQKESFERDMNSLEKRKNFYKCVRRAADRNDAPKYLLDAIEEYRTS